MLDDEELSLGHAYQPRANDFPRPISYHIVMAQVAQINHRFHQLQRLDIWDRHRMLDVVRNTDDELASVISSLPAHLQPDNDEKYTQPWIIWQKKHITQVLLYYRIVINRTMQYNWFKEPHIFAGPRAVCLMSSRGLITTTRDSEIPFAKQRSWYVVNSPIPGGGVATQPSQKGIYGLLIVG
jgi:hypothetical protein